MPETDIQPNRPKPQPPFEDAPNQPKLDDKPHRPPLSQLSADEYSDRIKEERIAQLDAAEAALKERQEAERDAMGKRHEFEAADIKRQRDALEDELKAIHAYAELWQRQNAELAVCPASERENTMKRHERERIELAQETGYDVHPPLVGDGTVTGFTSVPPRGHPWVRRITPVRPLVH